MFDLTGLVAFAGIPDSISALFAAHPWLDDAVVACFLAAMWLTTWLVGRLNRRRREAWAAAVASKALESIIEIAGPYGASKASARWNAKSGRLEITLDFPEGSTRMIGRLGIDPVAAAWDLLAHRPSVDFSEKDPEGTVGGEPPPAGSAATDGKRPWWDVLGVAKDAGDREVSVAYRQKAREAHPDMGGSDELMADINAARDAWRSSRGSSGE